MTTPLKVLQFICPTGFYGAERWILTLGRGLDPAQVRCDLAVTVEPGFDDLELARQYEKSQLRAFRIPMRGRFDVGVIRRLCALVRRERYDIIHSHGYKSDILGLIVARLTGIRALTTPHGFENADDWKLRAYIGLGNRFLKRFDVVAPLSEQLCTDVVAIGVAARKVVYVQNGVDLEEVEAQRERNDNELVLHKKKKRVGFIGQLISRKNVSDLLAIFDRLAGEMGNLELKLIGDGEQRAELERYADTLRSRADIEFLGFRHDRLAWLQSFDLFVITSTLEGIPRCLMETMAMGVPIAAYGIPGVDQLIKDGQTGLLAPLGDREKLTAQWRALLTDAHGSAAIAERAREYVLQNFSGRRMAREYTALFREMAGRSG